MKPMLGPCSECGEEIEFDDYMLGREAECPFCQGVTLCNGKAVGGFPTKIVAISAISLLAVTGVTAAIMKGGGGGGEEGETQVAQADGGLPPNPFSSGGDASSSSPGAPAGGGGGGNMDMGMMDMGGSMDMAAGNMDMGMDMGMAMNGGGGSGYDAIKPFLMDRCGNCHGAEKQRGDLRLDTVAGAMKAVTAGQASRSQLYVRVSLPADHDDIMPPRGAPLTAAQQNAIKAWIDGGAK